MTYSSIGIIPASAGNTLSGVPPGSPQQDHPRIRGEHRFCPTTSYGRQGSSPHPRGTPLCYTHSKQLSGIIPASAGNTASGKLRSPPPWDHPRIRGEHPDRAVRMVLILGSSPHPRGTQPPVAERACDAGIIPASAGNTQFELRILIFWWDHPRIRGEHWQFPQVFTSSIGSSPHPRGTRTSPFPPTVADRIIPASAGNTLKKSQKTFFFRSRFSNFIQFLINPKGSDAVSQCSVLLGYFDMIILRYGL